MSTVIFLIVIGVVAYLFHKNGFTKSANNKVIGGVSAGIAQRLNLNVSLVRVLTVIAGLVSAGLVLAVYIVLWITLPQRD
jgi:phage shock protein PspC (stress-responsive transcriptional regulator)